MGNLPFIAKDLAARFDFDFMETPPFSEKVMERGVALAPEFACLPLKAVLGSFTEMLDAGVDTLVTAGGKGPCRFGYYGEIQRRILEREGYEFQMRVIDPPSVGFSVFYHDIRSIIPATQISIGKLARELSNAMAKVVVFDTLEKWAQAMRGLEAEPGAVNSALDDARAIVSQAFSRKEIKRARAEAQERFSVVRLDHEREHLTIGLVGEIFVVLEPYFNFDIDRWLGKRGVVVERSTNIADTVYPGGRHPVFGYNKRSIARAASPYLSHEVGGDGLLSVGASALFAKRGFDAVAHFLPFTCMPEIIAKGVLERLSSEQDIPVLSLTIDEQTGRAGVETRLEALLDLARARRKNQATAGVPVTRIERGWQVGNSG
ncbi:MAG: CoA protein activase [Candidatus Anoxymicrobium japonicum]|uniref:CoA protein activase n=1 Tax=Candidatus Anoxymicrobium japonicum TaxID=2013648 RepID=A0A2N3G6X8_9ACTN|nr:MAG: CoA protein activase [Candidatus Anoxymicrobium japonicum]